MDHVERNETNKKLQQQQQQQPPTTNELEWRKTMQAIVRM